MESSMLYVTFVPVVIFIFSHIYKAWCLRRELEKIPAIGPQGILSSYLGVFKFIYNARDMIQEGYDKYHGAPFRVPGISSWTVVVSGPQMVEELRRATDEQVSFREAIADALQIDYTIGSEIHYDPYHVSIIRSTLTRNLVDRFPDVQDEIATAFAEYIPVMDEWSTTPILPTVMKIVCRSSNRLFVGLPLCRNPDFMSLNVNFTVNVMKAAKVINLFPNILKPIIGGILTTVSSNVKRVMEHLEPVILERLCQEEQYGNTWPGKPNDYLSWLLDVAEGRQRTIKDLTVRVLAINFAAIHTTSMAFTQVLLELADNPAYIPALREEIETVIKEHGLTKTSLYKMRKLDSFIKEAQRLNGNGALVMQRRVMKDFRFADGTVIPKNASIAVANFSMHHDEMNYKDATKFDGFRFANFQDGEHAEFSKHQMVCLSNNYVVFGHGRHACPGRFFAVNELKAMLIHTLVNYDIAFERNAKRPQNLWFGTSSVPDPTASIMFRKRHTDVTDAF